MKLFEQYRPREWGDVIGQDAVVKALLRLRDTRGLAGNVFWLSGGSGQGKTTVARLIAQEVAGELATHELNARAVDVAFVRDMERHWNTTVLPMGSDKTGRAWIFNEAHNLRAVVCEEFLTVLEAVPAHVVVIFTTTTDEQKGLFEDYDNAPAFLSRHKKYKLARTGLAEAFAERARTIAQAEGLDGQPIARYVELVKQSRNNMRAVLEAIEAGEMIQ